MEQHVEDSGDIHETIWGRWSRADVRVDEACARVTSTKGEYLVLSRVPRRRGKHTWEVVVRKKTPGCLMSVGICVDIQDSELTRGAQDTHFKDRVWHYCNTDGSFRNGGIMVPAKDQKTKLAYSTGDVITVQLNCEAGELTFLHNGLEIEGSIIRGVRHASFLERQAAAKDAREPVPEGVGEFYLMLSMSRGDMAEAEESVAELRYTTHEGNYPWHQPIAPNYPSIETGTPPFAFALSRPLPPGIELDPDTGIISGAPEGRNSMDMAAWREFCFQMYKGRVGDLAWKKSRTALLKELGTGLDAQGIAERARALFAEFDADGSGEIDLKELGAAMARLNVLLTTEELMHMAADVDIDGSAEIGVEEFSEMLQQMYSAKDKQSSWKKASLAICKRLGTGLDVEFELPLRTREVFNEFDDDRSGKIDMVELFHALTAMGVEVTEEEVELMIDEAGIDQGAGDDPGIDFPAFQELVKQMYTAQDEDVWDRARAGIIAMLGHNLSEEELWDRTDAVFRQLDEDGSGELDLRELGEAMKRIGLALPDDEVERMVAQSDVTNRLWTVTVANRLGSATCIIRMVTVEGVSELQYAAADIYAKVGDKIAPLKVARLRGAAPFQFAVHPPLPAGLTIDAQTGTVSGRAEAEVEKSRFTVTVSNEVNATQASFTFMSLRPPTVLAYQYPSTIYKEGRLRLGAWTAARAGLLRKLGKDVTADNLLDLTGALFEELDADGSGLLDKAELDTALRGWGVALSDAELSAMIREATGQPGEDGTAVFKGGRRQEVAGAAPEEIDYDTFHEIVEQMS